MVLVQILFKSWKTMKINEKYDCSDTENNFFTFENAPRLMNRFPSFLHQKLIHLKCYKAMVFDFRNFCFFHQKFGILLKKLVFSSYTADYRLRFEQNTNFLTKKIKFSKIENHSSITFQMNNLLVKEWRESIH